MFLFCAFFWKYVKIHTWLRRLAVLGSVGPLCWVSGVSLGAIWALPGAPGEALEGPGGASWGLLGALWGEGERAGSALVPEGPFGLFPGALFGHVLCTKTTFSRGTGRKFMKITKFCEKHEWCYRSEGGSISHLYGARSGAQSGHIAWGGLQIPQSHKVST